MPVNLQGLRTVIYPVSDLAAASQWWSAQLGFPPYFNEPFYVGFEVAGYELGLLPDADPADGVLTFWGVVDVGDAVAELLAAGSTEHMPLTEVGGGIMTAAVRSPQGNIVGLIYNPHFKH